MINLVKNDVGSTIEATITDSQGNAKSLDNLTCYLHVRKIGSSSAIYSLTGNITDSANGIVNFVFDDGKLDVVPGTYQSEIELVGIGGNRETVFDYIDITIRDEIA